MKIIEAEQRTPEWYSARLGRITGSRMKDVMSVGAKGQSLQARANYKRELVAERLTGEQVDKGMFVTEAMKWGIINEDIARTVYKLRTRNKVTEVGFVQHQEEVDGELKDIMVGVSPDGLVNDDGLLEIKCLMTHNHLYNILQNAMHIFAEDDSDIKDLIPKDYRDQVQMQMWVTGRDWCDFVGYDSRLPVGLDMFTVRVPRDDEYIELMKKMSEQFLGEVDRDFKSFLQYLPTAQRACKFCGAVYVDKLSICPEQGCYGTSSKILKIIEPALIEFANQVEGAYLDRWETN
jgi:hypothetical protein